MIFTLQILSKNTNQLNKLFKESIFKPRSDKALWKMSEEILNQKKKRLNVKKIDSRNSHFHRVLFKETSTIHLTSFAKYIFNAHKPDI